MFTLDPTISINIFFTFIFYLLSEETQFTVDYIIHFLSQILISVNPNLL